MSRKPCFIYFMKPTGQRGPVKIGCTHCVEHRLYTLAAWSPYPLEVVLSLPGNLTVERALHAAFAADHLHREWFKPSKRLNALIDDLRAGAPVESLIDMNAKRAPNIHKQRVFTPEHRMHMSYLHRLRHAINRHDRSTFPPRRANNIVDALSRGTKVDPSDIAFLEAVIASPQRYAISREEYFGRRLS